MKYTYPIGGREYTFQTRKQGRNFVCTCVEHPQAIAQATNEKASIEACINVVSGLLGQQKVKIVKRRKVRWVPKDPNAPKKPWWKFW